MFKKILVGYDGSKPSREALRIAFELARQPSSAVIALAVVRPPEFAELEGEIQEAIDESVHAPRSRWASSGDAGSNGRGRRLRPHSVGTPWSDVRAALDARLGLRTGFTV